MSRLTLLAMLLTITVTIAACATEEAQQQPTPVDDAVPESTSLPATEEVSAVEPTVDIAAGSAADTVQPERISIDTQGLPFSWQAVVVPESPYDQSMPPGPVGMPEHTQVLFGVTDPADRQPMDPVMYIIPVNAYRQMWHEAGSASVTNSIDQIEAYSFSMPSPAPVSGMPALPYEAGIIGPNDLAVQVGRAVPAGQLVESSSTQTGYRFVGRWVQDANPVTNQNLRYVYQGFTNDGRYLVSFFYPVSTSELPADAASLAEEQQQAFSQDPMGSIAADAEKLNALSADQWEPDLAALDALVASLQIEGVPVAGVHDVTWQWVEGPAQPGSSEIVSVPDPASYHVAYGSDGSLSFQADCNSGSTDYELRSGGMAGGMLANQTAAMTMAECGPESLYQGFMNSLLASQDYRVSAGGDNMVLVLPAGGGELMLTRAPEDAE